MSEGPDVWCYDALELPRIFASGLVARTILRTLEVIGTEFDTNPAMCATIVFSRVPVETYLTSASADDEVARYLRAHRTAGSTTLLEIASATPIAWWTIDGHAPDALPMDLPGSAVAGDVDETRGQPRQQRAVVAPGWHTIRAQLAGGRETEQRLEIIRGTRAVFSVD